MLYCVFGLLPAMKQLMFYNNYSKLFLSCLLVFIMFACCYLVVLCFLVVFLLLSVTKQQGDLAGIRYTVKVWCGVKCAVSHVVS